MDRYCVEEVAGQVFVVDLANGDRLAQIPYLPNPVALSIRSLTERKAIGEAIARLFNEESERCASARTMEKTSHGR